MERVKTESKKQKKELTALTSIQTFTQPSGEALWGIFYFQSLGCRPPRFGDIVVFFFVSDPLKFRICVQSFSGLVYVTPSWSTQGHSQSCPKAPPVGCKIRVIVLLEN